MLALGHFGTLAFLIYINDLSNDIKSKCKLFEADNSLFSVIHNIDTSANDLNHDLEKISEWAFQWEIKVLPRSQQTDSRNNIQQQQKKVLLSTQLFILK